MKNEEFQRIVLEELRDLKAGQGSLEDRMGSLESKLDAVVEQTAILTEFKEDTSKKLGIIIEENKVFKEIIGRHEVDIEMLKKKIC
jgi:hypothetical protein